MNRLHSMILRITAAMLCLALLVSSAGSAESGPPARSARDLAASLAPLQDGVSYVRLRLEVKRPDDTAKEALQIQIKERRTRTAADVLYQVLWPKERKGEAVLLHKVAGHPPTGSLFTPPANVRPLEASQMNEALFGSDLSYQDIVTDDKGRFIPGDLAVRGRQDDSVTDLQGSRIKHDVAYADREFTPEGLAEISAPRPLFKD